MLLAAAITNSLGNADFIAFTYIWLFYFLKTPLRSLTASGFSAYFTLIDKNEVMNMQECEFSLFF